MYEILGCLMFWFEVSFELFLASFFGKGYILISYFFEAGLVWFWLLVVLGVLSSSMGISSSFHSLVFETLPFMGISSNFHSLDLVILSLALFYSRFFYIFWGFVYGLIYCLIYGRFIPVWKTLSKLGISAGLLLLAKESWFLAIAEGLICISFLFSSAGKPQKLQL